MLTDPSFMSDQQRLSISGTDRFYKRAPHTWRSREDPFEHTWPTIQQWLETDPGITAKRLHERLVAMAPAM